MSKSLVSKELAINEKDTIVMLCIFFVVIIITPTLEAEKDLSEINLPTRVVEIEDSKKIQIDAPLPKQTNVFRQFFFDDRLPGFKDFEVEIPPPKIFDPLSVTEINGEVQGDFISANIDALIGTLSRIESSLSFASYFPNIKFSFEFDHRFRDGISQKSKQGEGASVHTDNFSSDLEVLLSSGKIRSEIDINYKERELQNLSSHKSIIYQKFSGSMGYSNSSNDFVLNKLMIGTNLSTIFLTGLSSVSYSEFSIKPEIGFGLSTSQISLDFLGSYSLNMPEANIMNHTIGFYTKGTYALSDFAVIDFSGSWLWKDQSHIFPFRFRIVDSSEYGPSFSLVAGFDLINYDISLFSSNNFLQPATLNDRERLFLIGRGQVGWDIFTVQLSTEIAREEKSVNIGTNANSLTNLFSLNQSEDPLFIISPEMNFSMGIEELLSLHLRIKGHLLDHSNLEPAFESELQLELKTEDQVWGLRADIKSHYLKYVELQIPEVGLEGYYNFAVTKIILSFEDILEVLVGKRILMGSYLDSGFNGSLKVMVEI